MTSAAEHIFSLRVGTKSAKNYISKINTMKTFVISKGYQQSEEELLVPLSLNIVQDVFGWLCMNTEHPNRNKRLRVEENVTDAQANDAFGDLSVTISASCMQGYKSALRWYYKEKKVTMETTINEWIDTFITGYKKSVATKKSRGAMKMN